MLVPKQSAVSQSLQQVFHSHRDRKWIFLRGLVNWGDELLFQGAERMADNLGLQWKSFETAEFEATKTTADHCIYLQGGGGFNSWSSGRAFVNLKLALQRPVHTVVQGPLSIGGDKAWLKNEFDHSISTRNCQHFCIFAREKFSLRTLEEVLDPARGTILRIDHDTALALGAEDLAAIADIRQIPIGNYDLIVVREDPEQPQSVVSSDSHMIVSTGIAIDPAYEATSFKHWVRIHLFARSIVTNRLHSSIIGRIAGKPVVVGPGSYHKNRSVWEYSMANDGPAWIESFEPPPTPIWDQLPQWIRNSYKVRRMRLALHRIPLN